jgi:NADPH2:quinone reductase
MKAIRVNEFGGPEVLKLEEISKPAAGAGEVLIAVKAVGINPVETYMRSGSNPSLPRPYTPGFDAAGIVEAVGAGVTELKVGDRVFTSDTTTGAYAQFTVAEAKDAHRFPENVTFEQAAAVNVPYATAYRALFQKARALPGETVFIHGGSGGVGIAAIQWCKAHGIRAIGTGGTEEGRQLITREGAEHALDHRAPDYLEKLTALTNGRGPDVILEMLSNVNLAKDLSVVAMNGRIVIIGSRGKIEIMPRDAMAREASIFGLMLFNATDVERTAIYAAIGAGLENGTLRPIVGKRFALADASKAHEEVLKPGAFGKIVLTI